MAQVVAAEQHVAAVRGDASEPRPRFQAAEAEQGERPVPRAGEARTLDQPFTGHDRRPIGRTDGRPEQFGGHRLGCRSEGAGAADGLEQDHRAAVAGVQDRRSLIGGERVGGGAGDMEQIRR